jgi:hypothetical protein
MFIHNLIYFIPEFTEIGTFCLSTIFGKDKNFNAKNRNCKSSGSENTTNKIIQ